MKSKYKFEKKDRSFIATWLTVKWNLFALRQIISIAKLQANIDNCAQYVVPIVGKYIILPSTEIKKQKKDSGKKTVLNINSLLNTSVYVAYPSKNNFKNKNYGTSKKSSIGARITRAGERIRKQRSSIGARIQRIKNRIAA